MNDYALVYRMTPEMQAAAMGSPEAVRQSMARWTAWLDAMRQAGQLKDVGLPLMPEGKVVRGSTATDGPYVETKELVGGFSIVTAPDLETASRIAAGCPILAGGGSVEVRPVRQLPRG